MHITEVQLKNIKSHVDSLYRFGTGTTAITGENGAGKTTILEGIAWALFDVLDYKKGDFIRRGAKKGTVRVTFRSDLDQREYQVYRDTSGGYHIFDPGLNLKLGEKKHDVAALIRQRLGVEPGTDLADLFRHAIGVPQGTFTAAFLDSAAARKAAFDKLLKVEEYRDSAELLLDTARLINDKTRAVGERIAFSEGKLTDFERLEAEHQNLHSKNEELAGSIAKLDQRITALEGATAEWDAAAQRVETERNTTARVSVEAAGAARRLGERQAERDRAAEAVTRKDVVEPAHQTHLSALARLVELEQDRRARDQRSAEHAEQAKKVAVKTHEVEQLDQAIANAIKAGEDAASLAPAIEQQAAIEAERERLRTDRAEAASAQAAMGKVDEERENLRLEYAQIREKIRLAEAGEVAEERLGKLRALRRQAENELTRLQTLETSWSHLTRQRTGLAEEAERLRAAVAESEREAINGSQLSALASRAEILQTRETELTELLAQLRANQARDEKMRAEVQNGLCPILSQKCLNLAPGENLDDYFRHQSASYDERVASAEAESTRVKTEVQAARDAEKQLARWETIKERLNADRQLLMERDTTIKLIDRELITIPSRITDMIADERRSVADIEVQESKANEDALLFAQLKPLRSQLEQVGARGARLSETRAELATVADRIVEIDAALAGNDGKLTELADPRARVAALNAEAARVEPLREERATNAESLTGLEVELSRLKSELDRYAELEATLIGAIAQRDETVAAHREYLACEPLAETLAARETELTEAQREKDRIETEAAAAEKAFAEAQAAYNHDRHAADRLALGQKREEAAGVRTLLKVQQDRYATLQNELQRLEAIRVTLREQRNQQEELQRLAAATEFIRDTLKQAGPLVARSYLYNISVEANQIFREISGDAARSLRWTEDYEVLLEEDGHERPFHNLSGGEQMAAALAIRLALLKQLSDIRVAFFDEPTANLDTERRERLAQQIAQIQHFDQLFIISHDDTFEDSVDHVVHVTRPDPQSVPNEPHADQLELAAQHE